MDEEAALFVSKREARINGLYFPERSFGVALEVLLLRIISPQLRHQAGPRYKLRLSFFRYCKSPPDSPCVQVKGKRRTLQSPERPHIDGYRGIGDSGEKVLSESIQLPHRLS